MFGLATSLCTALNDIVITFSAFKRKKSIKTEMFDVVQFFTIMINVRVAEFKILLKIICKVVPSRFRLTSRLVSII